MKKSNHTYSFLFVSLLLIKKLRSRDGMLSNIKDELFIFLWKTGFLYDILVKILVLYLAV